MKNQTEIIRERIEKVGEYSNSSVEQTVQDILTAVPKRETESVRAYRALMILVEYLDETDIDAGMFVDEFTISEQLSRLRSEIEKEAVEDVQERLDIDEIPVSFDSRINHQELFDPVSKATARLSNAYPKGEQTEMRKHHLASQIVNGDI